ncbi:phospholipase D-like domain-containing protein [Natronomonas sp. EA1]|uniref:phospholipase D-like domain-containing protein n=1 Tax=Natronomonas sp. EA1 TaxID=3421655 RepID=UPI003EBB8941
MRPVTLLVACLLLSPVATLPVAGHLGDAHIETVYPNPVADEDAGEFVVVHVAGPDSQYTLTDGEDRITFSGTASGRLVLSSAPNRTRELVSGPVVRMPLALANGGETLRLSTENETVDTLSYTDAPESETYDGSWTPLGATAFEVVHSDGGPARTFVLPDSPEVPVSVIENASSRVLLAGYTFSDERVADALIAAHERGVAVRVFVDASPVGGRTRAGARALTRLARAGIEVRVSGGPHARYRFHHAKYAVADDTALVMTENWKPAGTGGRSSRGWGVALRDGETAETLADVFRADAGWRNAVPWTEYRTGRTFQHDPPANGSFPTRFAPETVPVERASVLVAPDNAEGAMVRRLRTANDSIDVVQVSIGSRRLPLLNATLAAAERGVEVRVLLSSAWYVREENRAMVGWLNRRAESEGLPLEARLAAPRNRFEKVHAKGVIVDDSVLVGSVNWNRNSVRENREVVLALEGERVAGYYREVFAADWRASGTRIPVVLVASVAVGALAALAVGRRLRWER